MTTKTVISLTVLLLGVVMSGTALASTWDDIAALDATKSADVVQPAQSVPEQKISPRWLALSSGQRVDMNNWKVVVFMTSTCVYCHKYNPVVKQMADSSGFGLLSYSLDGKGDQTFPYPLTPTPEVMARFFGTNIPVATPTSFLVNVNTLTTFPLLQGNQLSLMNRLDEVFQLALQGGLR